MIIVEGPDGSGKSMLCKLLEAACVVSKILQSPRIAAKGDPERMKYETYRYLRLYGENNQVAVDRFLFSEIVYGRILRGKSVFSNEEYFNILITLLQNRSFVIFCMPDKLNFKEDENPVIIERMADITKGYEKAIQAQTFASHRTYIYKWDVPHAFDDLLHFLEETK